MIEVREIEAALLAFLQREVFAPEIRLDSETNLIASGFDSISLVRLLLFVEASYGLWLPEGEINSTSLENIRNLAGTVCRLLHER